MSAEIIPFRGVDMSDAAGCTMRAANNDELRAKAWSNFYAQERLSGASPELAYRRSEYFITKLFDGLIDDIRKIMAEPRW